MDITCLFVLEGEGVKKCEMTGVLVFLKFFTRRMQV